jgi:hypothetical protein
LIDEELCPNDQSAMIIIIDQINIPARAYHIELSVGYETTLLLALGFKNIQKFKPNSNNIQKWPNQNLVPSALIVATAFKSACFLQLAR